MATAQSLFARQAAQHCSMVVSDSFARSLPEHPVLGMKEALLQLLAMLVGGGALPASGGL